TLQVGGRSLWQVIGELSGKSDGVLTAAYRRLGDVGAVAGEVLGEHSDVVETESSFARPDRRGRMSPRESGQSPTFLPTHAMHDFSVVEVDAYFRKIAAARGAAAKTALVRDLLRQVSPLEAKYVIKIMTGDLRIGLKESLVEEAIGRAYGATLA